MRTLPDALRGVTAPTQLPAWGAGATHTWEVEAITPVLGGGVDSFEPDAHDIVRVPSIRGALRWWWRALQTEPDVDKLRRAEREAWGGVGGSPEATFSSAVRVWVDVVKPGRVVAAGEHDLRGDRLAVLPRWLGGRELGYGLFPLQQPAAARERWTGRGPMPTKSQREAMSFRLTVAISPREGLPSPEADVVRAVTLWLALGGYGARTRRGFGALSAPGAYAAARASLDPLRGGAPIIERPSLRGCALFESTAAFRSAIDAHRALLGALQEFRQGVGFARNPGGERPGRSRWPEPDTLRALSGRSEAHHKPAPGANGAPRAAFGLPIVATFKDRGDQGANAMLVPRDGGRWASPVLLRPVKVDGGYRAVVLCLAGHVPTEVMAHGKRVPVRSSAGASGEIKARLEAANNDATVAFTRWLCERRGFEAVTR